MNLEPVELMRFEIQEDSLVMKVGIEKQPIWKIEYNGEMIHRDFDYARTESHYLKIRKTIRIRHDVLYCGWCSDYKVGTKEYSLDEEGGYKEKLCPEHLLQAKKDYRLVKEVTT